jgi:hypothetical protein
MNGKATKEIAVQVQRGASKGLNESSARSLRKDRSFVNRRGSLIRDKPIAISNEKTQFLEKE